MAVYVDYAENRFGRMIMCHMVADTLDELHEMAAAIGMRRDWFQPGSTPHYDLSKSRRALAIKNGAIEADRKKMVEIIRLYRTQSYRDPEMSSDSSTPRNVRTTPDEIRALNPGEIFVFGSNLEGRHGKGAALYARMIFGAERGVGVGRSGQTYAIPTKITPRRKMPTADIAKHVADFIVYACQHTELTFLVTPLGCGLAGYAPRDIAPMFRCAPPNVILPSSFHQVINTKPPPPP